MKPIITLILLIITASIAHAGDIASDVRSIETGEYAGGDTTAQLLFLVIGVVIVVYLVIEECNKWKK